MPTSLKTARVGSECVACGTCISVCPRAAIDLRYGVTARIDDGLCIGCGKCAKICPAAVIDLVVREVVI